MTLRFIVCSTFIGSRREPITLVSLDKDLFFYVCKLRGALYLFMDASRLFCKSEAISRRALIAREFLAIQNLNRVIMS